MLFAKAYRQFSPSTQMLSSCRLEKRLRNPSKLDCLEPGSKAGNECAKFECFEHLNCCGIDITGSCRTVISAVRQLRPSHYIYASPRPTPLTTDTSYYTSIHTLPTSFAGRIFVVYRRMRMSIQRSHIVFMLGLFTITTVRLR